MRALKPLFGVIQAVVPVIYCGGLLYYFLDFSGSVENAKQTGLWPTILGLGAVGLFFTVVLAIKYVWAFRSLRAPTSRSDVPPDDGGFDADAAIARYKTQHAAEHDPPPALPKPHGPANQRSFGRKIR